MGSKTKAKTKTTKTKGTNASFVTIKYSYPQIHICKRYKFTDTHIIGRLFDGTKVKIPHLDLLSLREFDGRYFLMHMVKATLNLPGTASAVPDLDSDLIQLTRKGFPTIYANKRRCK